MSIKTITIVIILAILIGASIVYVPKFLFTEKTTSPEIKLPQQQSKNSSPTPSPTLIPVTINESSNLKEEINKIEMPDFSSDVEDLKKQLQ